MPNESAAQSLRTWWICGLLLCASTINYMDRQTLSNVSVRITNEFSLSDEQYGYLETAFGLAFAVGSTIFGAIADRTNVRWLYPAALLLWSLMGFLTGFVQTFTGLLLCRLFLGLFESGHWPCALRTTHRLLPPESKTLGNSVLQSGTAIGAVVTPLIMWAMLSDAAGSWRPAFQIIAGVGVFWIIAWTFSTRSAELAAVPRTAAADGPDDGDTFRAALFSRKFLLLVVLVVAINVCWHFFRVWMPKFLQTGRGYPEKSMWLFMFWFNVFTDVGCMTSGYLTQTLFHRGFSVHASRCMVFGICSSLVALGVFIPWLPAGPGLVVVLMLVALGALGLFPCYYSFGQELSSRHQGKIMGLLATTAWVATSPMHPILGRWADQTKSYDLGMSLASIFPLAAFFALTWLWPATKLETKYNPQASAA